jgi:sulfur carrier protein ThiS adenylyltransferase
LSPRKDADVTQETQAIFARNVAGSTEILARARVAIAGCGGLGSNAAVALTRSGVGSLILVDFDRVEPSNLNRQYFFQSDLGEPKVHALARHLRAINPAIQLTTHETRLTSERVVALFAEADLLIEAFDHAGSKKWLVEAWCKAFPEKAVVIGNGLSGAGHLDELRVQRVANMYFCGDGRTDMSMGLSAPRVAIVANMQAAVAVEILMGGLR